METRYNLSMALFYTLALIVFIVFLRYAGAEANIQWFDSRSQPGEGYLLIDDCFVVIKTDKIKDLCYVNQKIKLECGVDYKIGEGCVKR